MAESMDLPTLDRTLAGFEIDGFMPFTFDASPLQKYLLSILKQVEACRQENASLKAELYDLKVGTRLDNLEQSIQELADLHDKPGYGYGTYDGAAPSGLAASPAAGAAQDAQDGAYGVSDSGGQQEGAGPSHGRPSADGEGGAGAGGGGGGAGPQRPRNAGADPGWVVFEFNGLKERLTQMERKAETLWHVQESEEELRGLVNRLKHDVEVVRGSTGELSTAARGSQAAVEKLEVTASLASMQITELQDKMVAADVQLTKANDDKKEVTAKLENNVNLIWDQIRHVESSLSQRLTLAETSQISTLQEVDEMKEGAHEVMGRVEDVKRHIAALESKLESFNTQVAAALSPLHSSLGDVKIRLEELGQKKQDVATAVSLEDVNAAASRAIDHADRRTDNVIKSLGAMEERVEELSDLKANKCDVVMTTDLEALLTAHAAELDQHLDALKEEILRVVSMKADKEEMAALDAKLGSRISSLENAILKGLKAISDKVSAALAEKLDLDRFNEFKVQVRSILADVEDRLKDWSPMARGLKAPMDGANGMGATSCLCCDSRVRSVKELQGMGFSSSDKVFNPERLPNTGALFPSIQRSVEVASYNNPKVANRKKEVNDMLNKPTAVIPETLPAHNTQVDPPPRSAGVTMVDAAMFGPDRSASGNAAKGAKVDVETISGTIAQGRIPSRSSAKRTPPSQMGWESKAAPMSDIFIDTTQPQQ